MVENTQSTIFINRAATHEIGHILGLGHEPGTVMNKSIESNPREWNPHAEDLQQEEKSKGEFFGLKVAC